jgi:hypothetical protein
MVSDSVFFLFRRDPEEEREGFAGRLKDLCARLVSREDASLVVLYVDDGAARAVCEASGSAAQFYRATTASPTFHGYLLASGVPPEALSAAQAAVPVRRRVIRVPARRAEGGRTKGLTLVCPSVRLASVDHDEFDRRSEQHSHLHAQSSPVTRHYEQLLIDETPPGMPEWDGIGLLGVATITDITDRFYVSPEAAQAVAQDIAGFVDFTRSEIIAASEYVYRDANRSAEYGTLMGDR